MKSPTSRKIPGRLTLAGLVSVVLIVILAVSFIASDGGGSSEPSAGAISAATPQPLILTVIALTPTATPEATPTPFPFVAPQRRDFAPGELIDVSPAVLFADPGTGAVTAWAFSEWTGPEFGVAPSGNYVVYLRFREPPVNGAGDPEYRLLRTDNGSDVALDARVRPIPHGVGNIPIDYGPGDSGFVMLLDGGSAAGSFDGFGKLRFAVELAGEFRAASWSATGALVAVGSLQAGPRGQNAYNLAVHRVEDGSLVALITDVLPFEDAPLALEWSHNGQQLAVVAPNHVFVVQPDGTRLWEAPGDIFFGNPRWSPSDIFLFVNADPSLIDNLEGPEVDYVFTDQGVPLFRIVTPVGGGCVGDPWLSDERFQFASEVWSVRGELVEADARHPGLYPDLAAYNIILRPGLGFHLPHYDWSYTSRTDETNDGRLVFTTPEVGHGGCGEFTGGDLDGPIVERPPFGPWTP